MRKLSVVDTLTSNNSQTHSVRLPAQLADSCLLHICAPATLAQHGLSVGSTNSGACVQGSQAELQARSRVISAVFKVLDRLGDLDLEAEQLERLAETRLLTERLQDRFHEVWIQLLELQFSVERDAVKVSGTIPMNCVFYG